MRPLRQTFCGVATTLCLLALPSFAQETEDMSQILAQGAKVEKLEGNFKFVEGPVWVPKGGYLLFSDIPADTIYRWREGKKSVSFRRPAGNTNGHALDHEGMLVSCQHNRLVTRTEKSGQLTILADRYEGKRLNSPNDLAIKSNGDIYFTDPVYGITPEQKELDFRGVYRLTPDKKLTLLVKDFVGPNGIAFSPDEKRLYVADSEVNHIRVFAVQPDGSLANGRIFADLKSPGVDGGADGMKVDEKGNIYATGPAGVWVFAPSGRLLGKILPPEVPANCGFGDKDFKTLYMTARTGLYRIRLQIPGNRLKAKVSR